MDNKFGSWRISPASVTMFNAMTIVFASPLLDYVVYPTIEKCIKRRITPMQKIGSGIALAIFFPIYVVVMELVRRNTSLTDLSCYCGDYDDPRGVNSMSIAWQLPPVMVYGVAEAITGGTMISLFYSEVPASMKSTCQALVIMTYCLGNTWALVLQTLSKSLGWTKEDLNDGHVEYLFGLAAVLQILGFLAFLWFARRFQYKTDPQQ